MAVHNRHDSIGKLVAEIPARARAFERLGIDYCCAGHRPLDEVARERGLDLDRLVAQVEEVEAEDFPEPSWSGASDEVLIAHILEAHHVYLHEELPVLGALVRKVERAHGDRHPELHEVRRVYEALAEELLAHMRKEELVLFPMLRRLARGEVQAAEPCGGIENPLRVMHGEHEDAGLGLAQIRALTRDYAVPAGVCTSYRSMLARLEHLERDTHEHVHEEENVLFPRFTPGARR